MKTPSPQEAAKSWAREKARGLRGDWNILYGEDCVVPAEAIERALLETYDEADKNGYERGRKEHFQCQRWMQVAEHQARQDEAMLRECYEGLSDMSGFFLTNRANDLHDKLKARLAPSDSGGEKK